MKAGILALVFGYILSQFYRSFLAVLTPILGVEIGATSADLSFASGIWFVVFALMQIPVGWALDRFGPRITSTVLLAIGGGGGAAVFAIATGPFDIYIAMALFGIGGSPIYMAACYIFARIYPQVLFSTLAGTMIGFGSVGNLAGTAPLAYSINAYGWRETIWGLSIAALVVAAALSIVLKDPPRTEEEASKDGNLFSLLTDRNLLLLFPLMLMNYAPAAGLRGLWVGPYFENVFGLGQIEIGRVTMAMAVAMILGSFTYGPIERVLGSKKLVIMIGNLCVVLLCLALWFLPDESWKLSLVLFIAIGFFGVSYPAMMAHGQMFLPRHLTGRGMTLLNLLGIGGVGLMQFVTSAMARAVPVQESITPEFYGSLFLLFGLSLLVGCAIYGFSTERKVEHLDTQTD